MDRELLADFLSVYSFQPATAFWRAIELPALISLGGYAGRGIDIGCGDGKLTEFFVKRVSSCQLVGIDPDPSETAEARRRNIYTTVHTSGADRIPEVDGCFDFAISNSVLEHIPDLDPVLAEIARVLRTGGMFCFTVPHSRFHAHLRGPIAPGASRRDYEARLDRRLAHLRYPTEAAWHRMLEKHGFAIEQTIYYLDGNQLRRWETLSRMTAGLLAVVTGNRLHPIVLQRRLGLRHVQNTRSAPRFYVNVLALLCSGRPSSGTEHPNEKTTACVAIRCRKR